MGKMNLPNTITLLRIFLVPLVVVFLVSPSANYPFLGAVVFAVGCLSDWLDGHIARKRGQVTAIGKLLDPIADKLLVAAALLPLVHMQRVSAWLALLIIGREIVVTGFRTLAAAEGVIIQSSSLGKLKMFSQIMAIILLILNYDFSGISFHAAGTLVLWFSTLISFWSAGQYLKRFYYSIKIIKW